MAIMAIPGGTGNGIGIGRALVTAISQTSNTTIILSRKMPAPERLPSYVHGAEVRYVDYSFILSSTIALDGVDTVISAIKILGPVIGPVQLRLLEVAKQTGMKRFAPADFGLGPVGESKIAVHAPKVDVWRACEASDLGCFRFVFRCFMNCLAWDRRKEKPELDAGVRISPFILDVENRKAELPVKDDGTFPRIVFTEVGDVARFVARGV